jgi:CRISPR-associated endonuclease/helicase Cas3
LTPDNFAPFYRAIHGYDPFPWQLRLLRQVASEGWPPVLALPTAAGKTSAIDIAVFALALQAGKPLNERTAPLRVFFVIDRRLVVDQAAGHALGLKQALEAAAEGSLVRQVADALRQFGGNTPLHVVSMRGGMYRDDSWAKTPNQPTVCVSTVDQVGSRLLFRGYGVSEYARPLHAALAGNDALYLLDEAHLSQPFLETLQAVERYRRAPWAERPLGGPFGVVEISATPSSPGDRFVLTQEDRDDAELSRRILAGKPARLVEPARFEAEAAELAVKARSGEAKVIGVVVNRVASAREVFRRLPGEPFEDKVLLTGRIRPWERDALLGRCLERMRAGRVRSPGDRPLFVVATMTVEVGADLDFDHLITEAAPLPALRQRFGRLDRLGRFGRATGVILLRRAKGPDPIYGDELTRTWEWLRERAGESGGAVDFGVNALDGLIQKASKPPPPPTPRPAPFLFPAHLDAWVQTSPAPQPSPEVAPFLHGADALDTVDVQVVWRADLRSDREEDWLETVAAAPPRSREAMPVPVNAVREWLREAAPAEVSDTEGTTGQPGSRGPGRRALRWYGPDSEESAPVGPDDIRPGDTLVVPSVYGGADSFGWDPLSLSPVPDVGDLCVNQMANMAPGGGHRLIRLRLYDGCFGAGQDRPEQEGDSEGRPKSASGFVQDLQRLIEQGEDYEEALTGLLAALTARPPAESLTAAVVAQLTATKPRVVAYPAGVVLTARVAPGFFGPGAEAPEPEDDSTDVDDTSSLRAGLYAPAAVGLEEHIDGVVRWVARFASRLGVDEGLAAALKRAARLHDIGKADWRFQYMLYGDEPGDALLAKSGRDWGPDKQERVRRHAGLPRGFRHEFVSAALVRNHAGQLLADLDEDLRPLVAYLVGAHHGRGRPFVPVIEEEAGKVVTLRWDGHALEANTDHGLWRLGSGWTDGFWRLVRHYGYWGQACLEALLRLADAARSAEEQGQGREPG